MAVSWNEAVDGDLSNDRENPTALGTVSQGDNIITGALPNSPEDDEQDEFSFVVPDGLVVENIIVTQLNTTGFENGFNLFLRNAGGLVGGLNTANSGLQAGENLFDNPQFRFPGPLTAGTYTFDLRAFTTSFGANAYEFKLVVLPTNIVPVANNDAASTNEDTAVTLNVLGNDSDANGETLRITQVDGQAATVGSPITLASGALVTLNANGTFSFNPNGTYNSLAQGATTTQPFTYTITDGRRGTTPATATATITITGLNDAPTAIALSNSAVNENVVAAVIGNLTVIDPDTGDTQTFSLSDTRFEVVSGQLKLKSGISLDYETEQSVSLNVTATDLGGLSKTQSFTINVNDVVENTAPTDIVLSATTVNENVPSGAIVGNFSTTDAEGGDFTYTLVSGIGSGDNGVFSISGNQLKINTSPDFEADSSYSVRVRTTDAGGLFYEEAFNIGVTNVNEAPIAVDDSGFTANQSAAKVIAWTDLLGNDSDPDAGTTLSITGVSNAVGGSVALNGNTVVFTPTSSFSGTARFDYTLSDGSLTDTGRVTLEVGKVLNGGNGKDTLSGTPGDDKINGFNGADTINGGGGDDLLDGGNGPDVLTGGTGRDRFVLTANAGGDTITDFADGVDRIALSGGLTFGRLTILGSNNNTLIQLNGTTLTTLTGINSSLITATDFTTV